MEKVVSKDGTSIAFDKLGKGPVVILVSGAMGVRAEPMFDGLAALLAERGFMVINRNFCGISCADAR